jgi:aminopeptidase YwaD
MTDALDLRQLETRLRHHVQVLAQSPRVPGTAAHRAAQEYIAEHLQAAGFAIEEANYLPDGFPCTNLIARRLPENRDQPLLIVGAHYDTQRETPGADDNASAVGALLELARWIGPRLGKSPTSSRLQLLAYDMEEDGCIGSAIHAKDIERAGTELRGMISLEMLGYTNHQPGSQNLPPELVGLYPNVANFIGVCGNEHSRSLLDQVVAGMKTIRDLPVEFIAVPGQGETLPPVRLSDHSSFWDRGFPALMITDTSFMRNPHYHQATDTADTLDYPFLARVTAGVCEAVSRVLS